MYSLGVLALASFLLALLLTPLCRRLFQRWGVVDQPDGGRHLHAQPTARCGGVPILAAYLGAFAVWLAFSLSAGGMAASGIPLAWKLAPAVALIFAVGLMDDLRGLKPWQKFAGQGLAAFLAYWAAGVQVTGMASLTLPLWLSLPLTLLWLVGCCNAFNLIDGIDGLAAGAGLFATLTILAGALLHHNLALALLTVPLAGALLGFLRYNFNPASIFLGDSGSLTIGFLLGCYGVVWSQKSATVLGMTAPMMAVAVPLLDTGVAIARRFLRQQPIFSADAAHIHHRLLARGLTPRQAALLLYGACGVAASMSLLASVAHDQFKGAILVLFCAAAWAGVQRLEYAEFGVVGRMLQEGAFRRHLNSALALKALEDRLAEAKNAEECWGAVREACRKFGFTRAELRVNGHRFEEIFDDTNGDPTWGLDIPLPQGHLHLTRCFGESRVPTVLVPFAETLRENLYRNGHLQPVVSATGEDNDLRELLRAEAEERRKARGPAA
jgi:UDP-GlcNAc:undecaprenyl-phosphate GlcNAc-1-phosphate transferase